MFIITRFGLGIYQLDQVKSGCSVVQIDLDAFVDHVLQRVRVMVWDWGIFTVLNVLLQLQMGLGLRGTHTSDGKCTLAGERFSQTEVPQFVNISVCGLGDENVVWLDISVDEDLRCVVNHWELEVFVDALNLRHFNTVMTPVQSHQHLREHIPDQLLRNIKVVFLVLLDDAAQIATVTVLHVQKQNLPVTVM
ncbi:hypothetical protein WICPIJ_005311 [Wickerhamomyces pijperi]|uniref:Uncharacterized protein n=1 Tax=Wickerhamomyces pijperi TaxID=599730 RepID=A0A9P8Q4C1_WICPI|nr:hypothetical protein WICPIJ_005311 [Wickerhamomyces pijperi]